MQICDHTYGNFCAPGQLALSDSSWPPMDASFQESITFTAYSNVGLCHPSMTVSICFLHFGVTFLPCPPSSLIAFLYIPCSVLPYLLLLPLILYGQQKESLIPCSYLSFGKTTVSEFHDALLFLHTEL